MAKKPLKMFKVNNISEVRDVDAIYFIKTATDTEFSIVVTDAFGAIVNLKDLQTPAGIQGIASDDGTIEVTGGNFKNIRLSATLVNAINSALKPGDNISELVNDAGYLTSFTEIDPIFQASEASNFVSGDKANLDNQSGVNTGDETTLSIQTKRPLKTVDNKSLEGTGNIEIDYNTVINKPTSFPPSTHTHTISEITDFSTIQTIDNIPTDGSNNAVSSNGVFDALATKAPISSVHKPVTLGAANGLSLVTQQLSLELASSDVTGALSGTDWNTFNGKFNTPTGLTTNYLPRWNGSGFWNSTIFDNGTTTNINTYSFTSIDLDYQTYVSGGATITGKYNGTKNTAIALGNRTVNTGGIDFLTSNGGGLLVRMTIAETGNALIGTTSDNLVDRVQVAGTISASPATLPNQVVVKSQLDAESDSQIEISANSNTLDAWNKQTILFTANCTITVPATLLSQFGFVFRTLAGVTVTWAITAPFTWETTPTTTPEKTTGSFMRRGSTNTILLDF